MSTWMPDERYLLLLIYRTLGGTPDVAQPACVLAAKEMKELALPRTYLGCRIMLNKMIKAGDPEVGGEIGQTDLVLLEVIRKWTGRLRMEDLIHRQKVEQQLEQQEKIA